MVAEWVLLGGVGRDRGGHRGHGRDTGKGKGWGRHWDAGKGQGWGRHWGLLSHPVPTGAAGRTRHPALLHPPSREQLVRSHPPLHRQ